MLLRVTDPRSAEFSSVNPKGIASISPGLRQLPWVNREKPSQPQRGCVTVGHRKAATPLGLEKFWATFTQGSACRATLGWRPESLWDSFASRAPAGLEAQGDPFPALKRRAIFRLSLRDKVVCANFILFSKSSRTRGGKFLRCCRRQLFNGFWS